MRLLLLAVLVAGPLTPIAHGEALVVRGARVIVSPAKTIEGATIVIEDGKVKAVGTKVATPPLARVLDAKGRTVMAGFVCPATGLGISIRSVSRPGTEVRLRRFDDVDPADPVWEAARQAGVTTLVLAPPALGVGGRAAVVRPVPGSREDMSLGAEEPLVLGFRADTATIKAFRGGFDQARKWIAAEEAHGKALAAKKKADEERAAKAKAAAEKAKAEGKPAPAPAKPAAEPSAKPAPIPPKPPEDPKVMPFVRALRGEIACLVRLDRSGTAGSIAHLVPILKELAFAPILVMDGVVALEMKDELKAVGSTVLLSASLSTDRKTGRLVNAPRDLMRSGVKFALCPAGSSPSALTEFRHRLAILVKAGLPRAAALAASTVIPATLLGLEKRVGTVMPGVEADLVFLDGDPLDPLARVTRVLVAGTTVYERPEVTR